MTFPLVTVQRIQTATLHGGVEFHKDVPLSIYELPSDMHMLTKPSKEESKFPLCSILTATVSKTSSY